MAICYQNSLSPYTGMQQNAYHCNLKWTHGDLLPCYCYAKKSNSRTICTLAKSSSNATGLQLNFPE